MTPPAFTPSLYERRNGSYTVRYKDAVLRGALRGLVMLALTYLLALGLQQLDWVTHDFPRTVLWCVLPYGVAVQWLYQGFYLPHFERMGYLLVATSVPFALTPLGFALLQQPYSRGALLLTYLLCCAWWVLAYRAIRRHDILHLAYLDACIPQLLQERIGQPRLEELPLALHPLSDTTHTWDGVVVLPPADPHAPRTPERTERIRTLKQAHTRLYSVDAIAELLTGRRMLPHPEALWEQDVRPTYDVAKRVLDIALTLLTLPLWLPLCLLAALAIKLDSPGPVLFSQVRTGLAGQSFRLWKLRSMRHSASEEDATRPAQPGDQRITRIGRLLRRSRIDELPQLWNVLRGDMTLIGPRPEQDVFVQKFSQRIPSYPYRHLVRPGLTGWAQVQQGYTEGEEQTAIKLSYDLYYVAHYSLALDVLIAYKTARIVLTGFGAR